MVLLIMASSSAAEPTRVWRYSATRLVGLDGATLYGWDQQSGGIQRIDARTGQPRGEPVEVRDLNIHGLPGFWAARPGGLVARWDHPLGLDQDLQIAWRAPAARWSPHLVLGDALITWQYRPAQSVIALDAASGAERWRTKLEPEANGVDIVANGSLYVSWQQYAAGAPTTRLEIPQRIAAVDAATGRRRWTLDYTEATGGWAGVGDHLMVARGADLQIVHGPSGKVRHRIATGHPPNIYPRMLAREEVVYVGLRDAVTAYRMPSGEVLWTAPVALDGGPQLAWHDGTLYVGTAHSSIVALDAKTGARRFEIGTAGTRPLWVGDAAVVAGTSGFALPAVVRPEKAVVRGRVTAECQDLADVRVRVGPVEVEPDARGRYEAEVTFAGWLTIDAGGAWVEAPKRSSVLLELDGSGSYEVPDLVSSRCNARW